MSFKFIINHKFYLKKYFKGEISSTLQKNLSIIKLTEIMHRKVMFDCIKKSFVFENVTYKKLGLYLCILLQKVSFFKAVLLSEIEIR